MAVETLEGVTITGPNTGDARLVCDLEVGNGSIDLRIPRLMLLAGTYDVTAAIYSGDGLHPFDHVQHILRFDVDHGTPYEENGVVALGGSWEGACVRILQPEERAG
jgi:hypothetical protein